MTYVEYLMNDRAKCPWLPYETQPGVCDRCGTALTGRRKRWCSDACMYEWRGEHDWTAAREKAKRRDGRRCVKCGSTRALEVNHIVPRVGRGYGFGCHNHQSNLETLCHDCHLVVTKQQAAERRAAQLGPTLLDVTDGADK
ncbi:HNH endonuclease [Gordonia phage Guacamole]|uniref:HNH endonuclease n=1 Tax=Gordonia phage Guacamole TaxID=1821553 RepID=UPI00078E8D42|nr:HNH endonuclease [Gordonia phage Guacamole]AMS03558.1 HNH endonuclease [Gordonia phage Guacamole]QDM56804.1 HNH endonuclease [Gordonia phage JasperJr]